MNVRVETLTPDELRQRLAVVPDWIQRVLNRAREEGRMVEYETIGTSTIRVRVAHAEGDYAPQPEPPPALRDADLGLRIGNARTLMAVAHYAEASRIYSELRDRAMMGASRLPRARLYREGRLVAEISYNGRVWEGERCAFDPYGKNGGSLL